MDDTDHAKELSDSFWVSLSEQAYPLTKGAMRVPISLEPFLISKQKNTELRVGLCLVISAVKKLTEEYFHNEELRKLVAVDPLESVLIQNSQDMPFLGVIRIDLFYGESPKVVEINADFPDGLFMHDVTASHIQNINKERFSFMPNIEQFVRLLTSSGVKKDDAIFIAYNKNRTFLDEFELTRIKLVSYGYSKISTLDHLKISNLKMTLFIYKEIKLTLYEEVQSFQN